MNCQEAQSLIPWLLDEEVDGAAALEVEQHVKECASCCALLQREADLRGAMVRASNSMCCPEKLRQNIRAVLDREERRRKLGVHMWPAAAAAMILMSFVWKGVTVEDQGELSEVASHHAMNLPMDVEANGNEDLKRIQSYFNSKLRMSVHLPTLKDYATSVRGGRVVNVHDRQAAQVMYETPRGPVSIFIYEDPRPERIVEQVIPKFRVRRVHGYTAARWRDRGFVYSVVGAMPENEVTSVFFRSAP